MHNFQTLYELADGINDSWCDNEAVDWSEAQQLVSHCQNLPADCLVQLPEIKEIIQYAADNDEWDSGVVASWPDLIRADLENADKQYSYRADDDNWEVYSLDFTGVEEWKATVETETIAERLVATLSPKTDTADKAAEIDSESIATTAVALAEEIAEAQMVSDPLPYSARLAAQADVLRERVGLCEARSRIVALAEHIETAWISLTKDEQLAIDEHIGAFDLEYIPAMLADLMEEQAVNEGSIFDADAADIVRLTRARLPEPKPATTPAI